MGRWHSESGWGQESEGRPHAFPSHQTTDRIHSFLLLVSPLFPLLFFSFYFSPPFPGRQPSGEFEWRLKGRGPRKEDRGAPFPKVLKGSRAELEVGTKGSISFSAPTLAPSCGAWAGGAPRQSSEQPAPASGLFPVLRLPMEFLSPEPLRTWKNWLPYPKLTEG